MTQEKSPSSEAIAGWDSTPVVGKGIRLRFLTQGKNQGQLESGPWVMLSAKHCEALAEELLQESKKI
ncbi:hypothetical protein [Aquabacterium sp.]|uniref:hypothetical protein n=1 Tax=Aquabacterium sp. TaxID=1872578 RepID=UPI001987697C|nr:hypothetical protein [Aquabacterium sp.]MBC7700337.1 hypothetical protein [Aquabacterium sp.]